MRLAGANTPPHMAKPEPIDGLLDANVIIYVLTNRPPNLAASSKTLLDLAAGGGVRLRVTPTVVAECVYVLQGRAFEMPRERIVHALSRLVRRQSVVCEDLEAVLRGLVEYATGVDFVDGYLIGRGQQSCVYTWDQRDFKGRVPLGPMPVTVELADPQSS